jgi:hypothetical protein
MERAVAKAIASCRVRDEVSDSARSALGQPPDRPVVMVTPWSVCKTVTGPEAASPSRAQLNSATRAMHSFVRKFPEYSLVSMKGGRGRLALYERGDELSAMWAKLNSRSEHLVPLVEAKAALEHLTERRNEAFFVQAKKPVIFRFTSSGEKTTRRRKRFYSDISLPD